MTDMQSYHDEMAAASKAAAETDDPALKEHHNDDFWEAAIDAFNEHIAGDITTVDGTVLHTPRLKYNR